MAAAAFGRKFVGKEDSKNWKRMWLADFSINTASWIPQLCTKNDAVERQVTLNQLICPQAAKNKWTQQVCHWRRFSGTNLIRWRPTTREMQPAASVHREQIAAAERSEFFKKDQVSAV
jgi:hypothetical protein